MIAGAAVLGLLVGLFLRELLRLLRGIFITEYTANSTRQADNIGDAGAGDTRIMIFETTKRRKP